MKLSLKLCFLLFFVLLIPFSGLSKDKQKKEDNPAYPLKIDCEVNRTLVKNQDSTGTCWCFATVSFLESEILRMGKEEIDLSEMFIARQTYPIKAQNYIRLHGNGTFGQGSLSHDAINQIKKYGIVPENIYPGVRTENNQHDHREMFTVLKSMLDAVLKLKGDRITPQWLNAVDAVLNVYLGTPPETFIYKGKTYTPRSFAEDYLGLNLNNYIELTSFTHHPFYKKIRLEIPDNWSCYSDYINVPLDDLEEIVDVALKNGHSVVWDGDMSEKSFCADKKAYAIVPLKNKETKEPFAEQEITQELRQKTFDNFSTTDDHLMHIVGIAFNPKGTKFYIVKDSWQPDRKDKGYVYLSSSYFRLKTIAILLNKNALPQLIETKLKEANLIP